MAKALIMLVRVLALAGIILGTLVWSEHSQLLGAHIGTGFLLTMIVFVLAIIAITKRAVVPGILGVVFAFVLPVVGLKQLPLTFHIMGAIQIVHVVLALATIGVAESLYSAIRRAG